MVADTQCRWTVTPSFVLCCRLLRSTLFEGHVELGIRSGPITPLYYVYNIFLVTLQILHIVWFGYIVKMCIRLCKEGQVRSILALRGAGVPVFLYIVGSPPPPRLCYMMCMPGYKPPR